MLLDAVKEGRQVSIINVNKFSTDTFEIINT